MVQNASSNLFVCIFNQVLQTEHETQDQVLYLKYLRPETSKSNDAQLNKASIVLFKDILRKKTISIIAL